MRSDIVHALEPQLYPSNSLHRQEIAAYFDGNPVRPLREDERQRLGKLDLFLVAFSNRSGSTLLTELLHQAGVAVPPRAEVFNSESVIEACAAHAITSFTDYFLQVVEGWQTAGLVGFKIGPSQLFWLAEVGLLSPFKSIKIVNSQRQDRVLQAVSLYIARYTGQWHSRMDKQRESEGVEYSAVEIARALRQITDDQLLIEYFSQLHGVPCVTSSYEQVLQNPQDEVERVLEFLGCLTNDLSVDIGAVGIQRQASVKNSQMAEQFRRHFTLG